MLNGNSRKSSSLGSILIVDDEEHITTLLSNNLESESYRVVVDVNALHASQRDLTEFRIILSDAMSQPFTGRNLLQAIKANPLTTHIPVIIVAHSDSEEDILAAFDDGADDYILKPFSIRELMARIKSVLRRNPVVAGIPGRALLTAGALQVDLLTHNVTDDGLILPLTKTEFAILALLMKNKGIFFNRREIFHRVWPDSERPENDRIVDTNISRLRKKLGASAAVIVNQSGKGYAIV